MHRHTWCVASGGKCLTVLIYLQAGHSHHFIVKIPSKDSKEYTCQCSQACTVLEAIKSNEIFKKLIQCKDENIIIQLGTGDKKSIIATHFPCTCVADGETLIIFCKSEKIEEAQNQQRQMVHPKDRYSVFYIDTVGGINTKTKLLFRSRFVKDFKSLCVYGELGTTVEDALKRDGRFIEWLGYFSLSDNEHPKRRTVRTQNVDTLHQKTLKICLPLQRREMDDKCQVNDTESRLVRKVAQHRGVSVETEMKQQDSSVSVEEIYKLLSDQFPDLKEWMEKRFSGDSYQEELRRVDFGKIQQSFSEVHRVRKLLKLGKSVCKISVTDVCVGTGFVLFDNFILTNAHLFKDHVNDKKLEDGIKVFALFNYDDPEPYSNYHCFTAEDTFVDIDFDLDYAVLKLSPEGFKPNQLAQGNTIKIPSGLLKMFGPLPESGEACIIGHPAGDVKKMDPTWIIEKEKREKAVEDHLDAFKGNLFIVHSIIQALGNQGIENILNGGRKADKVGTYHTFMYHGSSGSPVFDARGRVFGLHTAGYGYGFPQHEKHVIEFAQALLTIFEKFVGNLREIGDDELLGQVRKAAGENNHLQKILNFEEPMDLD